TPPARAPPAGANVSTYPGISATPRPPLRPVAVTGTGGSNVSFGIASTGTSEVFGISGAGSVSAFSATAGRGGGGAGGGGVGRATGGGGAGVTRSSGVSGSSG